MSIFYLRSAKVFATSITKFFCSEATRLACIANQLIYMAHVLEIPIIKLL